MNTDALAAIVAFAAAGVLLWVVAEIVIGVLLWAVAEAQIRWEGRQMTYFGWKAQPGGIWLNIFGMRRFIRWRSRRAKGERD